MARTITAANSVFMLSVANLFAVPQKLSGYATDDAFMVEASDMGDVVVGVDGNVSAGFIPFLTPMTITLQADSNSIAMFDTITGAQVSAREMYELSASIFLPATSKIYTLTKGYLTNAKVMPDVKKVLGPQTYQLTWGLIVAAGV